MIWTEKILRHGDLELVLIPGIGGRLIDVVYKGTPLLFRNPDLHGQHPDLMTLDQLPSRATHIPFPLWGGEKTWIAPESQWPNGAPYPVLDSGPYKLSDINACSATMISSVCPESGLQIRRTITLTSTDSWTIEHLVTNQGVVPRSVGLWSVTMTKNPAIYFFTAQAEQSPCTIFGDAENALSIEKGIGLINCEAMQEFKLGAHPATPLAAARLVTEAGAIWLITRPDALDTATQYAHGHALEFYNSGSYHYGELEWHSPMKILKPEKSHSFNMSFKVIMEATHQDPLQVYQLIEAEHEIGQ